MNTFQRAASGVKAAARSFTMRWTGRLTSWSWLHLPGTNRDYKRLVGNGTHSSVAMACLLWIARTFPEAPIRVQERQADRTLEPVDDGNAAAGLVALIERPNLYYSGQLLWMSTITDLVADGNAYWIKLRAAANRVVELWYVPCSLIEPRWPDDGSAYLTEYRYKPTPQSDAIIIQPADVVHFRYGIDPENTRKGRSPLATALREIYTDDEAANFSAAVLGNMGVPGVIISPDSDGGASDAEALAVKAAYRDSFGGDNRGDVMVMKGKTKVEVLSWSPQQLNLRDLRQIPEERISALLGVPAIVAGLGAGLQRSTFANFREAREAAYESNIVPLQRLVAAEVYTQLLPDFSDAKNLIVDFDISGIRILQEDETAKVARLNSQLQAGAITVAEWRSALGYPSDATHDYYLRPINIVAIPVDEDAAGAATLTAESRRGALATNVPSTDVTASDTPSDAVASDTAPPKGRVRESKAAREQRYLQQVERSIHVVSRQAQKELQTAFARIADDVVARVEAHKSAELIYAGHGNGHGETKLSWPVALTPDHLVPDGLAHDRIVPVLRGIAGRIGEFVTGAVNNLLGTSVTPSDSLMQLAVTRAGLLNPDDQARAAVKAAVADGQAAGESFAQITQRIHDYVEAGHLYPGIADEHGVSAAAAYRADVIAQTEARTMSAFAVTAASREAGVTMVRISDGDGCGWQSHDDDDLADGSLRTLDDYEAYPVAHPNCVRMGIPEVTAA